MGGAQSTATQVISASQTASQIAAGNATARDNASKKLEQTAAQQLTTVATGGTPNPGGVVSQLTGGGILGDALGGIFS